MRAGMINCESTLHGLTLHDNTNCNKRLKVKRYNKGRTEPLRLVKLPVSLNFFTNLWMQMLVHGKCSQWRRLAIVVATSDSWSKPSPLLENIECTLYSNNNTWGKIN